MKIKSLFLVAAMALATSAAMAQSGFDVFAGLRTVVVSQPTNIVGLTVGPITNGAIDIRMFTGIVKVDATYYTNGAGETCTLNLQTSPDQATWTALGNYALAKSTSVIYTNNYYGTNLTATNTYMLPGTIVSPTAATAGFATSYLDPTSTPFTNSGAVTVTAGGLFTIGFKADDAQRYIRAYWTPAGTLTNCYVSATLTGRIYGGPGSL